jgi:hypothetical protein
VKQGNNYSCIATSRFSFLDIKNYLSPGSSYDQFIKAYDIQDNKEYFPYEYLSSAAVLKETQLPPYDAYFSTLKNCNVLAVEHDRWVSNKCSNTEPPTGPEKYVRIQGLWRVNGWSCMQDYLIFYNNADCGPFTQAVVKMMSFYKEHGIDMGKSAISVPGIARALLFQTAKKAGAYFSVFSSKEDDLHTKMRRCCFGGPSVIFTRDLQFGVTHIRGGTKTVQSIQGFDCNAMYLYSFAQDHPTGCCVRRRAESGYKPEKQERYTLMYMWLDHIAKTQNINIQHKVNSGSEFRIGPYRVDGYDPTTRTVYEFDGCL